MASKGSPYVRFKRALARGDVELVRLAAAELPRVELGDALKICWVMRRDARMYERAAIRWIGRFALECEAPLADLERAVRAFQALPHLPDDALAELRDLCAAHGRAA
jgi:hypothetical protein